jgi:hypothetical protein
MDGLALTACPVFPRDAVWVRMGLALASIPRGGVSKENLWNILF